MTTTSPQRLHDYVSPVYDSRRWLSFRHRPGDVIVCTPAKSGTTWTQMICALLLHGLELPLPLTRLSRWIERATDDLDAILSELEAQTFPRIVKTHTPLDGIPFHADARYVFCGRDPRDAYLSNCDHMRNLSPESLAAETNLSGAEVFVPPDDPNAFFPTWLTVGEQPWMDDGFELGSVMYLTRSYWQHRGLANIIFLHYADLTADCGAEMRRLAAFLGVSAPTAEMVEAASFANMRARADDTAPGAHRGEWRRNADFFRKARLGEWRERLSPQSLALYERVTSERLSAPLKRWLEAGRLAAGNPALL
jgi:hypothetical protein